MVTLYKIELTTDGTNFTTVYSNPSGLTLNLSSLSTTAELLSSVNVPSGSYTEARVTFSDHVTLVANNGTSTTVAVDPSAGVDSQGKVAITINTPTSASAGQLSTLVIDFNLAGFKLVGSTIQPTVSVNPAALGLKKLLVLISGAVTNLTTGTGFTLQGSDGRTSPVVISSTTSVINEQTGQAASLTNGQTIQLEGTIDTTTHTITANAITVNNGGATTLASASGTVTGINTAGDNFTFSLNRGNITPTGSAITVQISGATQFFSKGQSGQAGLSNITANSTVGIAGYFDPLTQTLNALVVIY